MIIQNIFAIYKGTDGDYKLNNNCSGLQLDETYIKLNETFLDFSAEEDKVIIVAAYEKENLSAVRSKKMYEVDLLGLNVINNEIGTLKLRNNNYHVIILLKDVYNKIKDEKITDEEVFMAISKKGVINIMSDYLTDKFAFIGGYIGEGNMQIGLDGCTI